MTTFTSRVDVRSADFRESSETMRALVDDLREKVAAVRLGGPASSREKHLARG